MSHQSCFFVLSISLCHSPSTISWQRLGHNGGFVCLQDFKSMWRFSRSSGSILWLKGRGDGKQIELQLIPWWLISAAWGYVSLCGRVDLINVCLEGFSVRLSALVLWETLKSVLCYYSLFTNSTLSHIDSIHMHS